MFNTHFLSVDGDVSGYSSIGFYLPQCLSFFAVVLVGCCLSTVLRCLWLYLLSIFLPHFFSLFVCVRSLGVSRGFLGTLSYSLHSPMYSVWVDV